MKNKMKAKKQKKGAKKQSVEIQEPKKVPVQFTPPPAGKISHLHLYIQSFKSMDKSFGMTILLDAAYLLVMFGMFLLFLTILKAVFLPVATALQSILGLFSVIGSSGQINPAVESALSQNFSTIKWFYLKVAVIVLGSIAMFFGMNSLYKAFIWFHLTKQKMQMLNNKSLQQYLKKFVAINMTWQLLWLFAAILVFLSFAVKAAAIALTIVLFAYLYFTPFFRAQLTEKHTLKQAYKETFVLGAKKFQHFAIPICVMFITVVFAWMLGVLLMTLLAPAAIVFFAIIFLVLATAWIRLYFRVIHKKVVG